MKKGKKLLFLTLILLTLSACQNNKDDINPNSQTSNSQENNSNVNDYVSNLEKIYYEVLDNKRSFIDKDNQSLRIEEYIEKLQSPDYEESHSVTYSLVDMDQDGTEEMVVLILKELYLILNYDETDKTVYAFEENVRGLIDLKSNGYAWGSDGATTGGLFKYTFNKNKRKAIELASCDNDIYKVDGKKVAKKEFDKVMDEFNALEDVTWQDYTLE